MDTATEYVGEASPFACQIDFTNALRYEFMPQVEMPDAALEQLPDDLKSFFAFMRENRGRYSAFDGGQMMFNFLLGNDHTTPTNNKTLLWSSHLGAYSGILEFLTPKPSLAILGLAGRANLDGRPYDGSAARFVTQEVQWLGEPERVVWCLHDEAPVRLKGMHCEAAKEMVERETGSRVWTLEAGVEVDLW